jgi:hypothetical protein
VGSCRNKDSKAADESNLNRCHMLIPVPVSSRRREKSLASRSFETTPRIIWEREQEILEGNT